MCDPASQPASSAEIFLSKVFEPIREDKSERYSWSSLLSISVVYYSYGFKNTRIQIRLIFKNLKSEVIREYTANRKAVLILVVISLNPIQSSYFCVDTQLKWF